MKSQDDIDTAPVLPREGARTEYAEIYVDPGEEGEIELRPEEDMRSPLLITSCHPRSIPVAILQIACGQFVLALAPRGVDDYKFGKVVEELVTPKSPLRILLRNCGQKKVKIAVTLVDTTREITPAKGSKILDQPGTYEVIKGSATLGSQDQGPQTQDPKKE